MTAKTPARRDVLKTAAAGFTANIFTGRVRGANNRVAVGFIGIGAMGSGNLNYALQLKEDVAPVAVCDVYQPHLEKAEAVAKKAGHQVKAVKDFREVIADKSIDAVCISTPDHWHAYMTIAACKAGKDVFVEKPACVYVEEGQKMIQAARKYKRIVQAGTMQRSGGYFKKAAELVQNEAIGRVTFCHTWQSGMSKPEGLGRPADGPVPPGLDWDMWLGPAPKRPFNINRWGVGIQTFPSFRHFWDYAGGAMTDWGVHLIDPIHQCMKDPVVKTVVATGERFLFTDNTETPDTMMATFHYPGFIATYESRRFAPTPLFNNLGGGTAIHGTKGTIVVSRAGCWLMPAGKTEEPQTFEKNREMSQMNVPHWRNFIECIRTRQAPISEIETCVKSTLSCLLGNLSMRFESRIDWDAANWTSKQESMRRHLKANYRAPWKLEV